MLKNRNKISAFDLWETEGLQSPKPCNPGRTLVRDRNLLDICLSFSHLSCVQRDSVHSSVMTSCQTSVLRLRHTSSPRMKVEATLVTKVFREHSPLCSYLWSQKSFLYLGIATVMVNLYFQLDWIEE